MLQKMRQQSQSAIILLLFGFIIFVFVFSFGAGSEGFRSGGCGRSNVAALVNGEAINDLYFQFHYDQELRRALANRPKGKILRKEDKVQIRHRVMESLVDQAILTQSARRLGLHVTDKERNESIRESPQFQDEGKLFSFKLYKMVVQRYYQTTLSIFEEVWREQMLAGRMAGLIQDTARISDDELLQDYLTRETKIDLAYAKVPAAFYQKDIKPTQEQIDDFIKKETDRVKSTYEERSDRYHKPKKLQIAHVHFVVRPEYDTEQVKDKREKAELSLDDLKKGADFAEQAKEYSEDEDTKEKGGDLGLMTREAMTTRWGAPFAEAAFELKKDGLSGLIKSEKGFHILKCTKVVEAEDHALEEVQAEIAKELLVADLAKSKARAEAERLLAAAREGKQFDDLIPEKPKDATSSLMANFQIQSGSTGPISRTGSYVPMLGVDEDLARAVFELTKERPAPDKVFEIKSPFGKPTFVAVSLNNRTEADLKAFDEKKQDLREQSLLKRRQAQLTAWLQNQRDMADIEVNQAFLMDTTPAAMKNRQR